DVRRVRPEEVTARRPEAVLHVRRRVIRREAEQREVVLLVLDLRSVEDREAELTEDRDDLLADDRDRVLVPRAHRDPPREREVERRSRELGLARLVAEVAEALLEPRLDLLLERVDLLSDGLPALGRRLAE